MHVSLTPYIPTYIHRYLHAAHLSYSHQSFSSSLFLPLSSRTFPTHRSMYLIHIKHTYILIYKHTFMQHILLIHISHLIISFLALFPHLPNPQTHIPHPYTHDLQTHIHTYIHTYLHAAHPSYSHWSFFSSLSSHCLLNVCHYVCVPLCMCTIMYVYHYAHVHICMCIHAYIYIYIYTYIHT
jgi:hypothetical protein